MSGNTYTTTAGNVWEGESYYDPLAFARIGAAWRYPLFDGLGSTRQLLDGSQNVTDTYTYEAFGNLMSSTGTTANPYRYVGSLGYYQTGSSLQHLGARYYLPEVGRFAQPDPLLRGVMIAGSGASPAADVLAAHAYVYCVNGPLMFVDPTGLALIRECDPCAQNKRCKDLCRFAYNFTRGACAVVAAGCAAACYGGLRIPILVSRCLLICQAAYTLCIIEAKHDYARCLEGCDRKHPCSHTQP